MKLDILSVVSIEIWDFILIFFFFSWVDVFELEIYYTANLLYDL